MLGGLTMNRIVPIASKYEAMLLDKLFKNKQTGELYAVTLLLSSHSGPYGTIAGMIETYKRPTGSKTHAGWRSPATIRRSSVSMPFAIV